MVSDLRERAVIFDMDGVLLDTEPLYTVAYDRIMAPYGVRLDPSTKLEIMGRRALHSAAHVINKFGLPLSPEEFLAKRQPVLEELFSSSPAVPGAEAFVRSLSAQEIRLAVATSTARETFLLKTRPHAWFSLFDVIVCGDDREVENPKPAPDIFLTAARRVGIPIQNCTIFEDSPSGVEAAAASGARTIALLREETDLALYQKADQIVDSFEDATPFTY